MVIILHWGARPKDTIDLDQRIQKKTNRVNSQHRDFQLSSYKDNLSQGSKVKPRSHHHEISFMRSRLKF